MSDYTIRDRIRSDYEHASVERLRKLAQQHIKWREGKEPKPSFSGLDMSGIDGIYLGNLRDADFRNTLWDSAHAQSLNAISGDFSGAVFYNCRLDSASLRGANFGSTSFKGCILEGNFEKASFRGSTLIGSTLKGFFRYTDFSNAYIMGTSLGLANISGALGLVSPSKWIRDNFFRIQEGTVVYKALNNTVYRPPQYWTLEPGQFIEEEVNYDRTYVCGNGVNFGTFEFVKKEFGETSDIWECILHWEDMSTLVVPYNTRGAARCGRLQLRNKLYDKGRLVCGD